jgi:putative endonuclease
MILCSDNSLYTGITNDLERRFIQHNIGKGAKYFRGRQAVKVVYVENGHNRSTASKRESTLKKLNSNKKIALITTAYNEINSGHLQQKIN